MAVHLIFLINKIEFEPRWFFTFNCFFLLFDRLDSKRFLDFHLGDKSAVTYIP